MNNQRQSGTKTLSRNPQTLWNRLVSLNVESIINVPEPVCKHRDSEEYGLKEHCDIKYDVPVHSSEVKEDTVTADTSHNFTSLQIADEHSDDNIHCESSIESVDLFLGDELDSPHNGEQSQNKADVSTVHILDSSISESAPMTSIYDEDHIQATASSIRESETDHGSFSDGNVLQEASLCQRENDNIGKGSHLVQCDVVQIDSHTSKISNEENVAHNECVSAGKATSDSSTPAENDEANDINRCSSGQMQAYTDEENASFEKSACIMDVTVPSTSDPTPQNTHSIEISQCSELGDVISSNNVCGTKTLSRNPQTLWNRLVCLNVESIINPKPVYNQRNCKDNGSTKQCAVKYSVPVHRSNVKEDTMTGSTRNNCTSLQIPYEYSDLPIESVDLLIGDELKLQNNEEHSNHKNDNSTVHKLHSSIGESALIASINDNQPIQAPVSFIHEIETDHVLFTDDDVLHENVLRQNDKDIGKCSHLMQCDVVGIDSDTSEISKETNVVENECGLVVMTRKCDSSTSLPKNEGLDIDLGGNTQTYSSEENESFEKSECIQDASMISTSESNALLSDSTASSQCSELGDGYDFNEDYARTLLFKNMSKEPHLNDTVRSKCEHQNDKENLKLVVPDKSQIWTMTDNNKCEQSKSLDPNSYLDAYDLEPCEQELLPRCNENMGSQDVSNQDLQEISSPEKVDTNEPHCLLTDETIVHNNKITKSCFSEKNKNNYEDIDADKNSRDNKCVNLIQFSETENVDTNEYVKESHEWIRTHKCTANDIARNAVFKKRFGQDVWMLDNKTHSKKLDDNELIAMINMDSDESFSVGEYAYDPKSSMETGSIISDRWGDDNNIEYTEFEYNTSSIPLPHNASTFSNANIQEHFYITSKTTQESRRKVQYNVSASNKDYTSTTCLENVSTERSQDNTLSSKDEHDDTLSSKDEHHDTLSCNDEHGDTFCSKDEHDDTLSSKDEHHDTLSSKDEHDDTLSSEDEHGHEEESLESVVSDKSPIWSTTDNNECQQSESLETRPSWDIIQIECDEQEERPHCTENMQSESVSHDDGNELSSCDKVDIDKTLYGSTNDIIVNTSKMTKPSFSEKKGNNYEDIFEDDNRRDDMCVNLIQFSETENVDTNRCIRVMDKKSQDWIKAFKSRTVNDIANDDVTKNECGLDAWTPNDETICKSSDAEDCIAKAITDNDELLRGGDYSHDIKSPMENDSSMKYTLKDNNNTVNTELEYNTFIPHPGYTCPNVDLEGSHTIAITTCDCQRETQNNVFASNKYYASAICLENMSTEPPQNVTISSNGEHHYDGETLEPVVPNMSPIWTTTENNECVQSKRTDPKSDLDVVELESREQETKTHCNENILSENVSHYDVHGMTSPEKVKQKEPLYILTDDTIVSSATKLSFSGQKGNHEDTDADDSMRQDTCVNLIEFSATKLVDTSTYIQDMVKESQDWRATHKCTPNDIAWTAVSKREFSPIAWPSNNDTNREKSGAKQFRKKINMDDELLCGDDFDHNTAPSKENCDSINDIDSLVDDNNINNTQSGYNSLNNPQPQTGSTYEINCNIEENTISAQTTCIPEIETQNNDESPKNYPQSTEQFLCHKDTSPPQQKLSEVQIIDTSRSSPLDKFGKQKVSHDTERTPAKSMWSKMFDWVVENKNYLTKPISRTIDERLEFCEETLVGKTNSSIQDMAYMIHEGESCKQSVDKLTAMKDGHMKKSGNRLDETLKDNGYNVKIKTKLKPLKRRTKMTITKQYNPVQDELHSNICREHFVNSKTELGDGSSKKAERGPEVQNNDIKYIDRTQNTYIEHTTTGWQGSGNTEQNEQTSKSEMESCAISHKQSIGCAVPDSLSEILHRSSFPSEQYGVMDDSLVKNTKASVTTTGTMLQNEDDDSLQETFLRVEPVNGRAISSKSSSDSPKKCIFQHNILTTEHSIETSTERLQLSDTDSNTITQNYNNLRSPDKDKHFKLTLPSSNHMTVIKDNKPQRDKVKQTTSPLNACWDAVTSLPSTPSRRTMGDLSPQDPTQSCMSDYEEIGDDDNQVSYRQDARNELQSFDVKAYSSKDETVLSDYFKEYQQREFSYEDPKKMKEMDQSDESSDELTYSDPKKMRDIGQSDESTNELTDSDPKEMTEIDQSAESSDMSEIESDDLSESSLECLLEMLIQRGKVTKAIITDLAGKQLAKSSSLRNVSEQDTKALMTALRKDPPWLIKLTVFGSVFTCLRGHSPGSLVGRDDRQVLAARKGAHCMVAGLANCEGSGSCAKEIELLSNLLDQRLHL